MHDQYVGQMRILASDRARKALVWLAVCEVCEIIEKTLIENDELPK